MPRPVGQAIVDHLFAGDARGRVPVVGVAGSRQTSQIAQIVAWLVHLGGRHVGLACRDGLFLADAASAVATADWDSGPAC